MACRKEARIRLQKPNLDNTRKLRGIYFIDPEDGESQETENARNKLEVPFEAAMTSKTGQQSAQGSHGNLWRVGAQNPTRKQSMLVLLKLMSPQESVSDSLFEEILSLLVFVLLPRLVLFWFVWSSRECCTLAGRPDSSRMISSHLITGRSYSFEWRRERRKQVHSHRYGRHARKSVLTIVGMFTRIEVYQILGKDSQSSQY